MTLDQFNHCDLDHGGASGGEAAVCFLASCSNSEVGSLSRFCIYETG